MACGPLSDINAENIGEVFAGGGTVKRSFLFAGSRSNNGAADRDMRTDGTLTNQTALIIPYACELQVITGSTSVVETWEAHVYKNGASVASLSIVAVDKLVSGAIAISFAAGDEVRLRQQNGIGPINRPRIEAFFKEL